MTELLTDAQIALAKIEDPAWANTNTDIGSLTNLAQLVSDSGQKVDRMIFLDRSSLIFRLGEWRVDPRKMHFTFGKKP
jgi:hypothetical protein